MDKVKIKRVKREHKKITTKEKILAGLGLGGTLIGGAGAIAPKGPSTQFVRTVKNNTGQMAQGRDSSSTDYPSTEYDFEPGIAKDSKKSTNFAQKLKNAFGLKSAQASELNAYLPNATGGSSSLPYSATANADGSTTITTGGQSTTFSNTQDLLNQISSLNQQSGSLTSEQQNQLTALTNFYYANSYNNSPSVIQAQNNPAYGTISQPTLNVAGAQQRTVTLQNGQQLSYQYVQIGNQLIVQPNDGSSPVTFDLKDGAGSLSVAAASRTNLGAAVSDILQNHLYTASSTPGTNLITPSAGTQTPASPVTVQVSNVVSINRNDQTLSQYAIHGEYNGQRYAYSTENGNLYNGNGQVVTTSNSGLTAEQIEALKAALQNAHHEYAIVTNADGTPHNLWDDRGYEVTDPTILNTVYTTYAQGTAVGAPIIPTNLNPNVGNGGVTPFVIPPVSPPTSTTTTVNPGTGTQFWSTEGVTQAYNQAVKSFDLTIKKDPSGNPLAYTITIQNNGQTISRTFTPSELNSFLANTWRSSDNFLNASTQDQMLFAAAVNARLQDPNIGMGIANLPVPNSSHMQNVSYVDVNGVKVDVSQAFSPNGLSFQADANWVKSLFPGSTVVDAGFPGGSTSSWAPSISPNDPRRYYEVVLPNGTRINVGLFLQSNVNTDSQGTVVNVSGDDARYFRAPDNSVRASIVSGSTGGATQTPGGSAVTPPAGAAAAPTITTQTLLNGRVGQVYSQQLSASGSVSAWSVSTGSLPAGLSFSPNGTISGTPTSVGTFNFTVKAQNSAGQFSTKNYTLTISNAAADVVTPPAPGTANTLSITTATLLPIPVIGRSYMVTLAGSNVSSWSATGLPAWASLNSATGTLTGTPVSASAPVTFTATARNSAGQTVSKQFQIPAIVSLQQVNTGTPTGTQNNNISTSNVNTGNPLAFATGGGGNAYSTTSGGSAFSGSGSYGSGSLGNAGGSLGGTFSSGGGGGSAVVFGINNIVNIQTSSVAQAKLGQAYSQTLVATCPTTNLFSWNISSGRLPQGLSLSHTGVITGTPTEAGTFTFTTRALAQDGSGSGTKQFSMTVLTANGQMPSVTDVVDDEGNGDFNENGSLVSGGQTASVTNVADDGEVEYDETTGSAVNLSGDDEVEYDEVSGTSTTRTVNLGGDDSEVEYDEVSQGGSGSVNLGLGSGLGSSGLSSGGSSLGGNGSGNATTYNNTTSSQGGSSSSQASGYLNQQINELQNRIKDLESRLSAPGNSLTNAERQELNNLRSEVASLRQALSALHTSTVVYADQSQTGGTYTVKKGDTLWDISRKYYGDGRQWRKILEANPQSLSRPGNVRTLRIGYVLNIPGVGGSATQAYSAEVKAQPAVAPVQTYSLSPSVESATIQAQNNNIDPRGNSASNVTTAGSMTENFATPTTTGVNQVQATSVRPSVTDVGDDEEVEVIE